MNIRQALTKLVIVLSLLSLLPIQTTNSFFSDDELTQSNTFQATCWGAPDEPSILSPASEYSAATDVAFSWTPTTNHCPTPQIYYNLQIFTDAGLSSLYEESGWIGTTDYTTYAIPESEYWFRVQAKDQYNYTLDGAISHLVIDRTAPLISGVTAAVSTPEQSNDTIATISWFTDELATSNLEYATVSGGPYSGLLPVDDSSDSIVHSRVIEGLLTDTIYYFRVESRDGAGNTATSAEYSFRTNGMRPGDPAPDPLQDVVINEFLPNPSGDDDAPMPDGEWVELYNRSGSDSYDLTGWYLTDSVASHILSITTSNVVSSDASTEGLVMGPGEFLVVYRDGDPDFSLNNDAAGDQVNLYNAASALLDQQSYNAGLGDSVLENKSFARFPDGTDTWFDPIPTPGGPNVLELPAQPELIANYPEDLHTFSFTVKNISEYKNIDYQLTYDSESGVQGIIGSQPLDQQDAFEKSGIILGTCSSGGTCVYHLNIKNLLLSVDLTKNDDTVVHLEKTIQE